MRSDATRCRLAREPRGDEGVGIGDWGDDAVAALSVKVAGRKEGKRRRCRVFLVDGFLKAKSYYHTLLLRRLLHGTTTWQSRKLTLQGMLT